MAIPWIPKNTWIPVKDRQTWRGRAAHPSCEVVEGGLVWIDNIPFIVRKDPWLGITLIAVDPKTLEVSL